jgi:hypothetical protein
LVLVIRVLDPRQEGSERVDRLLRRGMVADEVVEMIGDLVEGDPLVPSSVPQPLHAR